MKQKNSKGGIQKLLFFIGAIVALYVVLRIMGITKYLTIAQLQENKVWMQEMVTSHYWPVVILYILLYAVVITIAVPGFPFFTLAGGFLFGTLTGAFYSLIASFTGSIISFFTIKYFMKNKTEDMYHHRLEIFRNQVKKYGMANTLLMLHFLTIIPFFVINSLAAIANVSTFTFIWTTIIGSLPLLFVYSLAGEQLEMIEKASDIFSPTIITLFSLLIVLAIMPMLVRKYRTFGKQDIYEEK